MPKLVGDLIVEQLVEWGVKNVFGIPGHTCLGLIEAIRKNPNIDLILVRHEQTASVMASGYAKLTGDVGVCITIAGPGATNLMTGLYDAKMDRAPVLAITGQVGLQYIGPGSFQEIDQDALFEPVSLFNKTINSGEQAVELVTLALKHAITRRGVAHLTVPNDVQVQDVEGEPTPKEGMIAPKEVRPPQARIERAAKLIGEAERPVIIAGWGSVGESENLLRFGQKIGAPIATTFRGKGVIPEDHEYCLGILGMVGTPMARRFVSDADLLIVLGSSFSDLTDIPEKPTVQVDFDSMMLAKRSPVRLGLLGSMSATLPALTEACAVKDSNYFSSELSADRQKWFARLEREADPSAVPIRPPYIIRMMNELVDDDAVITVDSGDNTFWFGRSFITKRQRVLLSGYLGTMAFGFPAAMGAKLASPDRQVVCVTGDGGFSMAMGDFSTAVKFNIPAKVIVFNNSELAMISVEQRSAGYAKYSTELLNPNFAEFATSFGGLGVRTEDPSQLKSDLRQVLEHDGPALLDVVTDPKRF